MSARVAIFVPVLDAETTLASVIGDIPGGTRARLTEILVQDDDSEDATLALAHRLAAAEPIVRVVANGRRLGYGGTCKKAFLDLAERGMDVVVMVHGDGQHPPSYIDALAGPIEAGEADIVLGSRMVAGALRGGMPVYKWLANKGLTWAMNRSLRLRLTDYHTGFIALSADAIRRLDLGSCSDGHEITAETLVRAAQLGLSVREVAVPTSYGDGSRSCSVTTSIAYGLRVLSMLRSFTPEPSLEVR